MLKQWKMDDFQHGQVVLLPLMLPLALALSSPSLVHSSARNGLQRAQLSIHQGQWRAKNTGFFMGREPPRLYLPVC